MNSLCKRFASLKEIKKKERFLLAAVKMVEKGYDVKKTNSYRETSLHVAAIAGWTEFIIYLLENTDAKQVVNNLNSVKYIYIAHELTYFYNIKIVWTHGFRRIMHMGAKKERRSRVLQSIRDDDRMWFAWRRSVAHGSERRVGKDGSLFIGEYRG